MLSDPALALEVHARLLEARATLANSVSSIKGRCSDTEYVEYRSMIGKVLGDLILDVIEPIKATHPSLIFPE